MSDQNRDPLAGASIGYLFIMVVDFECMLGFYRDTLGMRVTFSDEEHIACLVCEGKGGPAVALHAGRDLGTDADRNALRDGLSSGFQDGHWFLVFDVPDLDLAVAALKSRGVEVGEPFDVPAGRAAKFRDPESNVIEFHQPESES